jgi:hypothetical protein
MARERGEGTDDAPVGGGAAGERDTIDQLAEQAKLDRAEAAEGLGEDAAPGDSAAQPGGRDTDQPESD